MAGTETRERAIEVAYVADLACPWCYIGLRRLDRARAMRPDLPVRVRWWPFLLNPFLPPEGMDRGEYVRAKFGGEAAARQVYERLTEVGRDDGIAFAFERMPRTPNTVQAQRLVLWAQERGEAAALIERLFEALFVEGRDVGSREVLVELAGEAGLETDAARDFLAGDALAAEIVRAHQQAERIGVRGVPVFIVERAHAVSGAQPPEVLAGLLDVAATEAAPAG